MLKEDRQVLWAGVLVLAVIASGIWWEKLPSPPPPKCETITQQDKSAQSNEANTSPLVPDIQSVQAKPKSNKPEKKPAECNTDALLTIYTARLADYTLWLFIATTVTAFFGLITAWLTNKSVHISEKALTTVERAYLSVAPRGIEQYKSGNGMLSCDVAFFNAGNLPAQNVRWIILREFDTNGLRETFELTKKFSGNNIIPPRAEMRKGGIAISHIEFDEFQKGGSFNECWLYVWGRVTYKDGFGKARFTDFCHRYNVLGARNWTIEETTARYHEFGNRTDESETA